MALRSPDGCARTGSPRRAPLTDLSAALGVVMAEAKRLSVQVALVGGLAVSVRTEPRFTRDIDMAVGVGSDSEAERFVGAMVSDGHELVATVEQEAVGRLAMARLRLVDGSPVDLLFASSGIEPEVVAGAEELEILPGITVPVASLGHLIAVKLLARDDVARPHDVADLRRLLEVAGPEELVAARAALAAITDRGFHRGRDLPGDLAALQREVE